MSVLTNVERIGSFTSSEIYNLTKKDRSCKGFGAPALSYIEEKRMERRLGRSISEESNARPLVWGKLLESYAFNLLGFDYDLCSQVTLVHPDYPFWTGTPDVIAPYTVADIKCPITLKSFCRLVDPIYDAGDIGTSIIDEIRSNHPDGEKYYWQLVSNAILTGQPYAELIVFVPYQSELAAIRELALDSDNANWILYAKDEELPYLPDGGYYNHLNTIRWEVSQADKDLLTQCVIEAGKLL